MFSISKKKRIAILDPDEVLADSSSALGISYGPEGKIERPIGPLTYFLFTLFIFISLGYLSFRAFSLQVSRGNTFFAESQTNRFFIRTISAPRGIFYDYRGKPVVENRPSFGILFEREEFLKGGNNLADLLEGLGSLLGVGPDFFYEAGFPKDYSLDRLPAQIVIMQGIEPERVINLALPLAAEPGISVFETNRRVYADSFAFSHVLGFVGKVSEMDILHNSKLQYSDTIGKGGIELVYDELIRGTRGRKILEVDARGLETRYKLVEEARPGSNIRLTIDGDLQRFSYETIKNYTKDGKGGSIIAVDPRNGAIRSLVSFPGFDSNSFGYSLSEEDFSKVLDDPLKPLFNRAVSGEFPSGSTIKPLVAAAALEEKIIDPQKKIYDAGSIEIPNPYHPGESSIFVDWRKHGWVNFYDAIAVSANVYFYIIGGGYQGQEGLGIDRLKKYMTAFGLGSILGIDIPGEKQGLFPDPEWKVNAEPNNKIWRIGDTYNTAIGQGGVKTTPLQMVIATSAIVNGGKVYQPYIFEGVIKEEARSSILEAKEIRQPKVLREGFISKESLLEVVKGMRQTVTSGTARLLSEVSESVAAKTGTAQAGSGLPHAWVTAFAPAENPEIAIVVMVEHAGEGSTVAVPIMRDILKWYFDHKPSVE